MQGSARDTILNFFHSHSEYQKSLLNMIGTSDEEAPERFFDHRSHQQLHHELLRALGSTPSDRPAGPSPALVKAFTDYARDPDVHIHTWLSEGAPLGVTLPIPTAGVFPPVSPTYPNAEDFHDYTYDDSAWSNYTSVEQQESEGNKL